MLEKEKGIDAVTVSTPDHHHGVAAIRAMKMGKHCFFQKPLTQNVEEARIMRKLATEKKLATQMGNQGSAENVLRRAVEVIQAGIIGKPKELHVWTNRPIWPQGLHPAWLRMPSALARRAAPPEDLAANRKKIRRKVPRARNQWVDRDSGRSPGAR